jgi:hypothetical protein
MMAQIRTTQAAKRPTGGGGGVSRPGKQRHFKGGQRPALQNTGSSGPIQKRAPYKMKRGNRPSFKDLGSSEAKKY